MLKPVLSIYACRRWRKKHYKRSYLENVDIKYIYDDKGRKKSVIVPIEVWEEIMKKNRNRRNVKKYRGIIRAKEIENEIKKLRDEWERDEISIRH